MKTSLSDKAGPAYISATRTDQPGVVRFDVKANYEEAFGLISVLGDNIPVVRAAIIEYVLHIADENLSYESLTKMIQSAINQEDDDFKAANN